MKVIFPLRVDLDWCLSSRHNFQVSKFNRCTSILLLIVFGFLVFKNLLAFSGQYQTDNCNEFAHVHKYRTTSESPEHSKKNEQCHGASMTSTSVLIPKLEIEYISEVRVLEFGVSLNYKIPKGPFPEPRLKPPRDLLAFI